LERIGELRHALASVGPDLDVEIRGHGVYGDSAAFRRLTTLMDPLGQAVRYTARDIFRAYGEETAPGVDLDELAEPVFAGSRAALSSEVAQETGLPYRLQVVANSFAELHRDNGLVEADLRRQDSPAYSYVDPKLNRVVIRYPTDDALRASGRGDVQSGATRAIVEAVARKFETVDTLAVPFVVEDESGCSLFYGACDPPLRGGTEFTAGAVCTTGFNVRSKADSKPYVLTSAHCVTDPGLPWSAVWSTYVKNTNMVGVGPTHNLVAPFPPFDDEAIMKVNSPTFWQLPETTRVLVQSSGGTRPTVTDDDYAITSVGTTSALPADGYLCKTGAVTDTGCHLYVGSSWSQAVLEIRAADAENSCDGDSGGPWFASHKGYGVHRASQHTANRTYTILSLGTISVECAVDLGSPNPQTFYISLTRAMSQLNVELSP
jgi:Trypsin